MAPQAQAASHCGEPTSCVGGESAGLRVLVVDDSEDAASTLALLLQMSGYHTATAADGIQALESVGAFQPDVVLLDIGLPGLNGHQVAERLRAKPGGDRLLLVAVTGRSQEADGAASLQAGFDAHLVKPLQLDRLLDLVAGLRSARRVTAGEGAATR